MTTTQDQFFETRVPTASDLALIIKSLREASGWTQETLAELSGLAVRTIQRVEKGFGGNGDTLRAIARGFGYEDLDVFSKPWPMLNPEKVRAHAAELERTTIVLPVIRIDKATDMRKAVEGADSSVSDVTGDVSDEAREAFAYLVDNLRDYGDVRDCYSEHDRIGFDATLQEFVDTIKEQNAAVAFSLRRMLIRMGDGKQPINMTNIYFLLGPADGFPSQIRVPKKFEFG